MDILKKICVFVSDLVFLFLTFILIGLALALALVSFIFIYLCKAVFELANFIHENLISDAFFEEE